MQQNKAAGHWRGKRENIWVILLVYCLSLLFFFPILYMFLTSLKSEAQAIQISFLFEPTLESFKTVLNKDIVQYLSNSVFITLAVTLLSLLFGIPATYALVFGTLKNPDTRYFQFVSANLLPPVGVIFPWFIIFRFLHLLDTRLGLIIIYTGVNIPLVIWIVTSFFKDVPQEIIEAAEIDGCSKSSPPWKALKPY
ncbi:binding-protein-dependent transport system inner membrane component [Hydrogenispora ethanolica]|uniref:Binding-protein-dependent transport system inner membrane component n=1 Tax=Hydrogenispora ethanolica TaxID=1082276 RepID=A0A4R1SAI9_HYDET|nr:carbohydrate ABC transporter permease [Hydrogenispora ethanolica]TCL76481.1 binding-protein-dependent transport system inner membrane component [Hydrogenispora ethanolica]